MKTFIDLVLVAIVLAGIVIGYKRGFVQTVAKPVKVIAVWFFSIQCCSFFANTFIAPLVREPITKKFTDFLEDYMNPSKIEAAVEDIKELIVSDYSFSQKASRDICSLDNSEFLATAFIEAVKSNNLRVQKSRSCGVAEITLLN